MPVKQQQSLGISVSPLVKNGQMRSKQFPAEITVPISQERIVTAPQAGLLDTLYVAAGWTFKVCFVRHKVEGNKHKDVHDCEVTQ